MNYGNVTPEASNNNAQNYNIRDKDLEAEVTSLLENQGRESGLETNLHEMPSRVGAHASEGEGPNKIYAQEEMMDEHSGRDSMANSSKIKGYNSEMTKDEERSP